MFGSKMDKIYFPASGFLVIQKGTFWPTEYSMLLYEYLNMQYIQKRKKKKFYSSSMHYFDKQIIIP